MLKQYVAASAKHDHPSVQEFKRFIVQNLKCMQDFLLSTIQLMMSTAIVEPPLYEERDLAHFLYDLELVPNPLLEIPYINWNAPATKEACAAKRLTREKVEFGYQILEEFHNSATKQAVAEFGLERCGLPSCGETEVTVFQFKKCAGCLSVCYCSPKCSVLDWKAHKPACRAQAQLKKV